MIFKSLAENKKPRQGWIPSKKEIQSLPVASHVVIWLNTPVSLQAYDLATDLRSLFHLNRSVVMLGYVIWFIRMRILRAPSWVRRHQGEYAAGLFYA